MIVKLKLFWDKLSTFNYNPRYSRLAGDIECYKPQLDRRVSEKNLQDAPWAKQAEKLIQTSEAFLKEFKIDEAWKTFHTARRLEVFGMDGNERTDLANELRMETAKLNEWRKEAVLELIGRKKFDMPDAPTPQAKLIQRQEEEEAQTQPEEIEEGVNHLPSLKEISLSRDLVMILVGYACIRTIGRQKLPIHSMQKLLQLDGI